MMKTDWKHIYSVLKENKQEMNYFLVCSMTEKSVQSGRNIQIKCVTQTELKLMRSFTSYVVPVRERSFRDIQMDTDLSLHLETAGWTRTNWRDYICHLVDGSLRRSWRCCWGEERVGEALKQKQKRSRLTKRCLLHFVTRHSVNDDVYCELLDVCQAQSEWSITEPGWSDPKHYSTHEPQLLLLRRGLSDFRLLFSNFILSCSFLIGPLRWVQGLVVCNSPCYHSCKYIHTSSSHITHHGND